MGNRLAADYGEETRLLAGIGTPRALFAMALNGKEKKARAIWNFFWRDSINRREFLVS
jgi:hypothetical protein